MDLTVETKQYRFSCDRTAMSYILVFLCTKLRTSISICDTVFLTKKEMVELIDFIKTQDFGLEHLKERCLDQLSNMEMLMEGKEKAEFRFW